MRRTVQIAALLAHELREVRQRGGDVDLLGADRRACAATDAGTRVLLFLWAFGPLY